MSPEDRLQVSCVYWFDTYYPKLKKLLFHPANGGSRNAIEGMKFKRMGVRPGVADLIFLYGDRVLAIELKAGKGRQQPTQKEWQELVESQGIAYVVIRDLGDFMRLVQGWMRECDKRRV